MPIPAESLAMAAAPGASARGTAGPADPHGRVLSPLCSQVPQKEQTIVCFELTLREKMWFRGRKLLQFVHRFVWR